MNGNTKKKLSHDDDLNGSSSSEKVATHLPQQQPQKNTESAASSSAYSIEVCRGPDCTGLGGGAAVLEIEELVREYSCRHDGVCRIRVVAGGCRDFCTVGPNAHVLVRNTTGKGGKRKKRTSLLESFSGVKDAASCDRVASTAIAYASAAAAAAGEKSPAAKGAGGEQQKINEKKAGAVSSSSSSLSTRSMMARKAERIRWEALKDVSRKIARSQKTVAASPGQGNSIRGKLKTWKETCTDTITAASNKTTRFPSERDKRRTERLIEIASEKLDRICLGEEDDESDSDSDSSCCCSSSSSNDSGTGDDG